MWDIASIAVKAIVYGATFCAAGGTFFLLYSRPLISLEDAARIRRWVALCLGTAIVASALRLSLVAGSMGDGLSTPLDVSLMRMVLEAGEARATGLRLAGLLLTGAILLVTPFSLITASLGALLAAVSFAFIGHAWAMGGWSVAFLCVHLIGVAFWLGALVPLLLIARQSSQLTLARTAKRFGEIAVALVGMLLVAGAMLLVTFLHHVSDLWTTEYGRVIAGKIGIVAMLLIAAASNKWRFVPRLQSKDPTAAVALARSIRVELVLGGLVLTITATLTSLLGPRGKVTSSKCHSLLFTVLMNGKS